LRYSSVDNWGLAATSLVSVAVVLLFQHGRTLDISTLAQAATLRTEAPVPSFVMTITAKRAGRVQRCRQQPELLQQLALRGAGSS
jgi:hypothetical protein